MPDLGTLKFCYGISPNSEFWL